MKLIWCIVLLFPFAIFVQAAQAHLEERIDAQRRNDLKFQFAQELSHNKKVTLNISGKELRRKGKVYVLHYLYQPSTNTNAQLCSSIFLAEDGTIVVPCALPNSQKFTEKQALIDVGTAQTIADSVAFGSTINHHLLKCIMPNNQQRGSILAWAFKKKQFSDRGSYYDIIYINAHNGTYVRTEQEKKQ